MGQLAKVEAVEVADVGLLQLPGCAFSEVGLTLAPDLEFEQWMQVGVILCRSEKAVKWWIGDWLAYGEHTYGEKYAQGEAITGVDQQTLQVYNFVSTNVPNLRRRKFLSWSHHREVAALLPSQQEHFLSRAEKEKAGKLEVRRWVQQAKLQSAEKITDDQPVQAEFVRVRVRWREIVTVLEQFAVDFPQFRSNVEGFIGEMKEELEHPVATGATYLEQQIELGTWEIDGLVEKTKYRRAAVIALCDQLIQRGTHEWRDKGGETEQARGARTKYIAPKGAPRGDYYEAYHGDRMSIIQDEDD